MREWYTSGYELRAYQGEGGDIVVPSVINGHTLTNINPFAFSPLKKGLKAEVKERRLAIRQIRIEEGYKSIDESAFEGCEQLETVSLPNSIQYIYQRAFAGTGIRELYLPSGYKNDESLNYRETFLDCKKLQKLIISEGIEDLCGCMFEGCEALREVTLPSTLSRIRFGLFASCTSLSHIALPQSTTRIEDYAFMDCGLEEITIPAAIKDIEASAFDGCRKLRGIVFSPKSELRNVGQWAFRSCVMLEEMVFPDTVEKVADSVFSGCKKLKRVVVPSAVNKIYLNWFSGVDNLQRLVVKGDNTSILDRKQDWDYEDREESLKGFRKATIVAHKGSEAEHFTKEEGYNFEELVDAQ